MSEGKLGKNYKLEKKTMEEKQEKELLEKSFQEGERMKEHEEGEPLKGRSPEQARLEKLYGHPFTLLAPDDKSELFMFAEDIVSDVDGEVEVKRLVLENRLPIIVGADGNWYTDWYPEGWILSAPLMSLFWIAESEYGYDISATKGPVEGASSPQYLLRKYLAVAVITRKKDLIVLAEQLNNEGESSAVLERQIDCLEQLNTDLPPCPEESPESLK